MKLQIGTLDLPLVFAALCLWTSLYFVLCHVDKKHSSEWHCRIVTAVHGVVITALAAWCAFVQGPWPFTDSGGPNTDLQWLTVTVCLGYFIFDFSWCIYFNTEGGVMMVHHCLSIFGLSLCLIFGWWGTELVATICGGELTNPLLQLRWFLREVGKYNTWYGEINDIVFMLLFGFIRIGVGSVLLYSYFQQPTDYIGRLGGVCIYCIGWLFFIHILQFAVRKYRRKWRAYTHKRENVVNAAALSSGSPHSHCNGLDRSKQNGFVSSVKRKQWTRQAGINKFVGEILNEIPSVDEVRKRVVVPGVDNSAGLINDLIVSNHVSCLCQEAEERKML